MNKKLICNQNNNKLFNYGLINVLYLLIICILFCQIKLFAQDKILYDNKGRRDPFIALVTPDGRLLNLEPTGEKAKVSLEGIIYDKNGKSYAIINGEVVSAGDYVVGHSVVSIGQDKVILMDGKKQVEYKLQKEEP